MAAAKHVDSDRMLWNALQNEVGAQVGRNAAATWERQARPGSQLVAGRLVSSVRPVLQKDEPKAQPLLPPRRSLRESEIRYPAPPQQFGRRSLV